MTGAVCGHHVLQGRAVVGGCPKGEGGPAAAEPGTVLLGVTAGFLKTLGCLVMFTVLLCAVLCCAVVHVTVSPPPPRQCAAGEGCC